MKTINIKGVRNNYKVIFRKNILNDVTKYLPNTNKVAILTDCNVPFIYVETLKVKFEDCLVLVLPNGEKAKSFKYFQKCLELLLENGFEKTDLIIGLGGGVVTDLAGMVAANYKRGMKVAMIPTTTLAMIDASVGSKNAINCNNIKNAIGTFYDPCAVLIDVTLLNSLTNRQIYNGLVESLKCGLINDESLFNDLESNNYKLEDVIYKTIKVKKYFIEKDPLDKDIRHALNFGHTFGHAYEALSNYKILHGEAVGYGMLSFLDKDLAKRVEVILNRWNINKKPEFSTAQIIEKIKQDKKSENGYLSVVYVDKIGSFNIKKINVGGLDDGIQFWI